jgi:hypothetical protein
MITNRKYVFDLIDAQEIHFFCVKEGTSNNVIDENHFTALAPSEVKNRIEAVIDNYVGILSIELFKKSKKDKSQGGDVTSGTSKFKFNTAQQTNQSTGTAPSQAAMNSSRDREFQLLEQINDLKLQKLQSDFQHQMDLSELKRKMDDSGTNPMVEKGLGFLMEMYAKPGASGSQSVGIAGVEDLSNTDRLKSALKRLAKVDKGYIETIEAIANNAEEDANRYFQFRAMIVT